MKASFAMGTGLRLAARWARSCSAVRMTRKRRPRRAADFDEVVPAGEPEFIPGTVIARYWAEADPQSGRLDLYEIKPGNKINRVETRLRPCDTRTPAAAPARTAACRAELRTDGGQRARVDGSDEGDVPLFRRAVGCAARTTGSFPATGCPFFPAGSTTWRRRACSAPRCRWSATIRLCFAQRRGSDPEPLGWSDARYPVPRARGSTRRSAAAPIPSPSKLDPATSNLTTTISWAARTATATRPRSTRSPA